MSKDNSTSNQDNILYFDAYRVDDDQAMVVQVELLTDAEYAAFKAALSDEVKAGLKHPKNGGVPQAEIDAAFTMFMQVMDILRKQKMMNGKKDNAWSRINGANRVCLFPKREALPMYIGGAF